MRAPLKILFLGVHRTSGLEAQCLELGEHLEQLGKCVTRSLIQLERYPELSHCSYVVSIEIGLPSTRMYADNLFAHAARHQHIRLALPGAYTNARRQLRSYHRTRFPRTRREL